MVTAAATAVNADDVVVETFRSDLLARTAIGLTGCENKYGFINIIQFNWFFHTAKPHRERALKYKFLLFISARNILRQKRETN